MNPQRYFWETFSTLKRDQIYLRLQLERLDKVERIFNIGGAIASSSAIGGWVIWKEYSFVWAAVIAVSQVANAVKPHLPYGSQLKAINSLLPDFETMTLAAERNWFRVARGEMTEDETIESATKVKQMKAEITQKFLKGVIMREREDLTKKADIKGAAYMTTFMEE